MVRQIFYPDPWAPLSQCDNLIAGMSRSYIGTFYLVFEILPDVCQ